MSERIRVAVPTNGTGGLESERSGHFGHCDCFTVVDLEDGAVVEVSTIENPPHVEGGCLTPVNLLAGHGIGAMIVAGMGGRPLAGFNSVGISVYFDNVTPKTADAVALFADGRLPVMDPGSACGGH